MGSRKPLPHRYLGLDVARHTKGYYISQECYHEKVKELEIETKGRSKESVLSSDEKSSLRKLLGKLLWPAMQSRPDMVYPVSHLIGNIGESTISDVMQANKLIRKLKSGFHSLIYPNLGAPEDWQIVCFCDASLSNNNDSSTQGGYLVYLCNQKSLECSLIAWQSCKLKRIARSTLAAECIALIEGADCAILSHKILFYPRASNLEVKIFTDNASLVEAVYSTKQVNEKKLRLDIAYIKELCRFHKIQIAWISTAMQLADPLTKAQSPAADILDKSLLYASLKHVLAR